MRVWIGVPARGNGPVKYANYFRALRAAGLEPYYPDAAEISAGSGPSAETSAGSVGKIVTPADCDALLLPGGGDLDPSLYGQPNTASRNLDPDRDALEWELLEAFLREGKPVLGICRGMQSINVFFGGTLFQDIPGHSQTEGRDRLHPVRPAHGLAELSCPGPAELSPTAPGAGELFPLLSAVREVNSAHHQAVDRLGEGLAAVHLAPDGVAETVVHRTLPVWGVQWHPERLAGGTGEALFRAFGVLCERERGRR